MPDQLPDRPFYIGVVGAYLGRARFGAALARKTAVRVSGIVDADSLSGRRWAAELPGRPAVFKTAEALFAARPETEGMLLTCPVTERPGQIEAAAAGRVSILTEFPFVTTITGADALQSLAAAAGALIMPAFLHRHFDAVEPLEAAAGRLGEIGRVRAEITFPLSAGYALDNGIFPAGIDWYDILQAVGGRAIDLGIRWLGRPSSVNADIDLPHHAAIIGRRSADPVANLIVNHERGQSTHLLKLSRSVQPEERYRLTGANGTAELILASGEKALSGPVVRTALNGERSQTVYSHPEDLDLLAPAAARQLAEFAGAVRAKSSDGGAAARLILETIQAAFVSARDGIRVPLPLINAMEIDAILESG